MKVRYDLPDFLRRVLAAERRPGNQIFAHRQSASDNRIETNLGRLSEPPAFGAEDRHLLFRRK